MNRFVALSAVLLAFSTSVPAQEKQADSKSSTDAAAASQSKAAPAVKTRVLKVGSLKLHVPATWKDKKNASRMRLATVEIPPVAGDKDPAELSVFRFQGQDVQANIDRWINQFQADGRKDKTTRGKTRDGHGYYFVEVSGTFKKPDGPPIMQRTRNVPGYRLLGVILPVKGEGVYFFKLVGPDKTVAAQAKPFRDSFGADAKTEKPHGRA